MYLSAQILTNKQCRKRLKLEEVAVVEMPFKHDSSNVDQCCRICAWMQPRVSKMYNKLHKTRKKITKNVKCVTCHVIPPLFTSNSSNNEPGSIAFATKWKSWYAHIKCKHWISYVNWDRSSRMCHQTSQMLFFQICCWWVKGSIVIFSQYLKQKSCILSFSILVNEILYFHTSLFFNTLSCARKINSAGWPKWTKVLWYPKVSQHCQHLLCADRQMMSYTLF